MREEQLLNYLKNACPGKKRRVSGAELKRTLHISGTDLCKLVHRLRCKGVPVASDRHGYYYATTAGEIYATIRILRKMVEGLLRAIKGLEDALDAFGPKDSDGGDGL